MGLTKSQEEDYKRYYKDRPDEDFSLTRHKHIMDKTIRQNDELRLRKQKDYVELIKERANVIAYYLKSRAVDAGKPIEKYISKYFRVIGIGSYEFYVLFVYLLYLGGDYKDFVKNNY